MSRGSARVVTTAAVAGAVTVNESNLQLSASRTQVFANSGSIGWVDPFIGYRVLYVD